ncbi:MAG: acyltransferase, partial [Patescibacteria group bacterium]
MNKERFEVLDHIRGLSIVGMIFIHSVIFYPSSKILKTIVDLSQFVVVAFIFCSAYLFYQKESDLKVGNSLVYFRKRFSRLLLPYYIFLPFLIGSLWFSDKKLITTNFIFSLLTMSFPYPFWDWLIVIFLFLSILMPLTMFLLKKYRLLFSTFSFLSVLSSIILLFYRPQFNFKLIMWLPWMSVVFYAWFFVENKNKKHYLIEISFFILLAIFVLSLFTLWYLNNSLLHFDNKFPPNIFHLSYGLILTTLLFVFFQKFQLPRAISSTLSFFSKHSYSVYFIHIVLLYFIVGFFKLFY